MMRSQDKPTLNELLEKARHHVMTDEEKEAQRQSWIRGEMAIDAAEKAEGNHTTRIAPVAAEGSSLTPQSADWRKMCITEIACENQSVSDYVKHWEGRAETAEARVSELEQEYEFWHKKAGDEHAKVAELEKRIAELTEQKKDTYESFLSLEKSYRESEATCSELRARIAELEEEKG